MSLKGRVKSRVQDRLREVSISSEIVIRILFNTSVDTIVSKVMTVRNSKTLPDRLSRPAVCRGIRSMVYMIVRR
jgi:predicted transcriptional regulator of viral defense system